MPNTIVAPVNTSQLVGGAQTAVALTPVASDPAVSATTAQVYAKTDKNLYHEDISGNITNLLLPSLAANSSLGPQTIGVGPFLTQNSSSYVIAYGIFNTSVSLISYVVQQKCSLVGISACFGGYASATGTLTLTKNGSSVASVLSLSSSGTTYSYASATFGNGVYVFNAGDQLNFTYSGGQCALIVGATLNAGSQSVSSISSPLTANTTVASTDNQRTWVASSSTAYTLTLPATNASQDFYVRVLVSGGAGVTVQAPSGVTIYLGATVSQSAGIITSSAAGSTIVLVNPAGSSVWLANSITGNWSVT